MEKELTLPEALGVSQKWFNELIDRVEANYDQSESISQFMESEANVVRDEELGEIKSALTKYERKLVLLGYLVGLQRCKGSDPMASFIEFLLKHKGSGDE